MQGLAILLNRAENTQLTCSPSVDKELADALRELIKLKEHPVFQVAEVVGGKVETLTQLPDGSGAATVSTPLPADHWLIVNPNEFNVPPMKLRMGTDDEIKIRIGSGKTQKFTKEEFRAIINEAGKYAVRCATMNGKEEDFDPDALLQNLVVGFVGYFTENGLSSDSFANPKN